ncbi:MAG: BatA domain-containing protein [Cytophagaceae bacterium]
MSFLAPVFFFGLLSVFIPIIIHLFDFQKPKKITFSNIDFLKEVIQQQSSTRKLKHWLILLSRILFLISLTLAFTQPVWNYNASQGNGGKKVITYVDNSKSMEQELNAQSALENATLLAQQLSKISTGSTGWQLFSNDFTGDNWSQLSAVEFSEKVSSISYSGQSKKGEEVLRRIQSVTSKEEGNRVFLLSDFQQQYWDASTWDLLKKDTATSYYLVPIANPDAYTMCIDSIWLDQPVFRPGQKIQLHVLVAAFGKGTKKSVVKLYLDNIQISSAEIELDAGQSKSITLDLTPPENTSGKGFIQLDDSPVSFDNTFYFTLPASPVMEVVHLCDYSTSYVSKVLQNEPMFHTVTMNEYSMDYSKIEKADVLIIDYLNLPNTSVQDAIVKYSKLGKTTILIAPKLTDQWNNVQTWWSTLNISILPSGKKDSTQRNDWVLDFPDPSNPFYEYVFAGKQKATTPMPYSVPSFLVQTPGDVLLKYKNGNSFAKQLTQGKGTTYVISGPLTDELSSLPRHSLIVPLFYKMIWSSIRDRLPLYYRLGNGHISLRSDAHIGYKESLLLFKKDSLQIIPSQNKVGDIWHLEVPNELTESGFVTVWSENKAWKNLAFNIQRGESNLPAMSSDEMAKMFENEKHIEIIKDTNVSDFAESVKSAIEGKPLWKYCVILALIFLLLEIALIRLLR